MENKLRLKREELGLTQVELADMVGVTSRTIISLEKGQYKPSIILAYKLSLVFKTSIEDLFCLKENLKREMTLDEDL